MKNIILNKINFNNGNNIIFEKMIIGLMGYF